jgi:hypothetical protein
VSFGRLGEDLVPGLSSGAPDDTVEMANGAADDWLDELCSGHGSRARLPAALRAVASRARALAQDGGSGTDAARARVRTPVGWIVVHGSVLSDRDGAGPRVAVWLEAARPPEMAPLIANAYVCSHLPGANRELIGGACTPDTPGQWPAPPDAETPSHLP